jgi:hypothetical protein
VVAVFGLPSGAEAHSSPARTSSSIATIYIRGGEGGPRFVAPEAVMAGEQLRIIEAANPRRFGPDTFSLVTEASIPTSGKERRACFTSGHICRAIAAWHGARGSGPPSENLVKAGAEGWDTPGSVSQRGDSWFTGMKQGASIVQPVTAGTLEGPVVLHFMSAIHPWMHGSITVLPAVSGEPAQAR